MARPLKEGLDYFPHDTDAAGEEKVDAMRALFGNDGYAFYFILLERIYKTTDGILDISKLALKASIVKKIGVTMDKFDEMLVVAFDIGLFDEKIYIEEKCITSSGIQKRLSAVDNMREKWRNKKSNQQVIPSIISGENPKETEGKSTQRKEKKRKENINKENKESLSDVEVENEKIPDEPKPSLSKNKFSDEAIEITLSNELLTLIKQNNSNFKEPDLQKWAKHIDLMIRIDKRSICDIREIINWCQMDRFWKTNILSTEKLREKFDALWIKSREPTQKLTNQKQHQQPYNIFAEIEKEEKEAKINDTG